MEQADGFIAYGSGHDVWPIPGTRAIYGVQRGASIVGMNYRHPSSSALIT
jgi:hypothetical protein